MSPKTMAIIAIRAAERRNDPIGKHLGRQVYLYRGIVYAIEADGDWTILLTGQKVRRGMAITPTP